MSRRGVRLTVLLAIALAGCRSGGEKRPADDKFAGPTPPGETTGRQANPDTPAHWLDRPKPNWMHGGTPPAATWKDPKSPDFNPKTDATGLLAGYVEDPDGRKVGNVYIEVRESGDSKPVPIGVLSQPNGAFHVDGLKPKRNYQLKVDTTVDGRKLFQTVYVSTPNPSVRIALLETEATSSVPPAPAPAKPPEPPPGSIDPLKKSPTGSIPAPTTQNGPLPVPDFGDPSAPRSHDALPRGERFDLMTDQGTPEWKPPVATVPPLGRPLPGPIPATRGESRKESLGFVDHTGQEANLPTAKLVLMNFCTAASMACVRAVPLLNTLHEKYADRGLAVVGVGCEDEPLPARVMAANQFRKDNGVKYPLLTESTRRAGEVLKRYGITDLPTAVLLNDKGEVVWQGNPNKATGLVEAIEATVR